MLRKIRNIILTILALLLIVVATITTIIEMPAASRWLVTFAATKVGVQVGQVNGNLRSGLDIGFIEYATEVEEVAAKNHYYRAENVSFRWHPAAIFYGTVSIQSLRADKVSIRVPVGADKTGAVPFSAWPHLGLPVRIELDGIKLKNIHYQQGDFSQQFAEISGFISLGTFHLRYQKLHVQHSNYALTLNGATDLEFPYETEATLAWKFYAGKQSTAIQSIPAVSTLIAAVPAASPIVTSSGAPGPIATSTAATSATATTTATTTTAATTAPLPLSVPLLPVVQTRLRYQGKAKINGNLPQLTLVTDTVSPLVLQAIIKLGIVDTNNTLMATPTISIDANWHQQILPPAWWFAQQAPPTTSGKLHATGDIKNYSASLTGNIHIPKAPPVDVNAQAQGNLEQITFDYLRVREQQVAADSNTTSAAATNITLSEEDIQRQGLELIGKVQWSPHLEWQANASAQSLNIATVLTDWPSNIDARFATRGSLKDSQWQGQITDLILAGHLRNLRVEGSGSAVFDRSRAQTDALHLVWGANQFNLKGIVGETLHLEWNLQAPLLEQLDPGIKGSLTSKGQVRGTWQLPQIQVEAKAENFAWKDYAVESLVLSLAPPTLASALTAADQKTITNSETKKAEAKKTETKKTETASLDAGATEKPAMKMSGAKLSTAALLSQKYVLDFAAKKLYVGDNYFSQLLLKGNGSIKQHELEVIIKSRNYGNAELGIAGRFDNETWDGKFTQFGIKIKKIPRWWLTSSEPIRINKDNIEVGNICLSTSSNLTAVVERNSPPGQGKIAAEWQPQQSPVKTPYAWLESSQGLVASKVEKLAEPQLCLHGKWNATTGAIAQVRMDSVPLRQFYTLFKTEVYFAGVMNGGLRLEAKTFSLKDLQAELAIVTQGAELRYQFASGGTEVYPWRDVKLNATVAKGQLDVAFAMEWQGYGHIDANTQVDLVSKKINGGDINATFSNLAPLETLLVFANDVTGNLAADLQIGGTFSQPYLLGNIQLRNGSANLPKLGVDLEAIEIQLTSTQAGAMSLISSAQSAKGTINVRGDLQQFGSEQWQLQGIVSGADFEIISLPQLKATLSPNVQVTASREAIRFAGDTVIPWARANIKSMPEAATQVSKDVVIIDDANADTTKAAGIPIYTNVNLILGDDVRFKGFGLDSQLSGRLNLFKDSNRQLLTTGFVNVKQGSYRAYGQSLKIERGRLIFQGDYENPGLDIRASREIEGTDIITVGLEISGTLQRASADVFSSPAQQNEGQAMMMLLTGKADQDASNAGALLLLSAAGGLGGNSDEGISDSITRFFRVDELTVKSDKGVDQSELWVGKYITPRLLVRYIVGVFEQAFGFGVIYQLTDELRIEAVSGEEQSVDMIYKIER